MTYVCYNCGNSNMFNATEVAVETRREYNEVTIDNSGTIINHNGSVDSDYIDSEFEEFTDLECHECDSQEIRNVISKEDIQELKERMVTFPKSTQEELRVLFTLDKKKVLQNGDFF